MRGTVFFLILGLAGAGAARLDGGDEKAVHALDRLTFGRREGDVERVRKLGLKKWIDLQLHPSRIPESAVLRGKLSALDTLGMPASEMLRAYPPPQILRAVVDGRIEMPQDPERRRLYERLIDRYKLRVEKKNGAAAPARSDAAPPDWAPQVREIVGVARLAAFRSADARGKAGILLDLPAADRDRVLDLLPPPVARQLSPFLPAPVRRRLIASFAPQQVVAEDLAEAKLYRAIYSERQLEELLVDFWFNHFNVFLEKGADYYLVTEYEREAIRPHVLGKFKDLLLATAQSPAMLFYLDNWQSRAPVENGAARRRVGGLNENYGRELLELHTLGVDGGYTQRDVVEVARCFTGWTIRAPQLGGGFYFDARMHDKGEKTVLGIRIPAGGGIEDGRKVLDILSRHPSTARFISRQLATRFLSDDPPRAAVDRMAKAFLKSDGDLRAVMKTMLRSKEFWAAPARLAKVKSPFEMVVSAVRAAGAEVDSAGGLANVLAQMGEPLYRKQEPTGYSNRNAEWVNSAALLARMNFALALTSGRIPGVRADGARAAFLAAGLPAESRAAVESAGDAGKTGALVLGSPEFQRR